MAGPFELSLRQFAAEAGAKADLVVHDVVAEIGSRIVERTPVGMPETWKEPPPPGYRPGAARGNWQLTQDSPATGTLLVIDPTGEVTKDKIAAAVPAKAAGKTYYLTNCLPYAWRLETGWSRQAPNGMVGLVAVEFNTIVNGVTAATINQNPQTLGVSF